MSDCVLLVPERGHPIRELLGNSRCGVDWKQLNVPLWIV